MAVFVKGYIFISSGTKKGTLTWIDLGVPLFMVGETGFEPAAT